MQNFFQVFIQILFVITFIFLFIMAVVLIKPFKLNKKRMLSTLSLKISYLIYLVILLVYIYFLLFFQDNSVENDELGFNIPMLIISILIPNISVFIRRWFDKYRVVYNIGFSFFNLFILIYLIVQLFYNNWSFKFGM